MAELCNKCEHTKQFCKCSKFNSPPVTHLAFAPISKHKTNVPLVDGMYSVGKWFEAIACFGFLTFCAGIFVFLFLN
tara:strand:- start:3585 stop:3812 length:228 start_codon:yes stop_codon:yes gene_type:complete